MDGCTNRRMGKKSPGRKKASKQASKKERKKEKQKEKKKKDRQKERQTERKRERKKERKSDNKTKELKIPNVVGMCSQPSTVGLIISLNLYSNTFICSRHTRLLEDSNCFNLFFKKSAEKDNLYALESDCFNLFLY